jgi:hypothetical protein
MHVCVCVRACRDDTLSQQRTSRVWAASPEIRHERTGGGEDHQSQRVHFLTREIERDAPAARHTDDRSQLARINFANSRRREAAHI